MAEDDEVEQTPHGGTRIRAQAPPRRPVVAFDPDPPEEGSDDGPTLEEPEPSSVEDDEQADEADPSPPSPGPRRAIPPGASMDAPRRPAVPPLTTARPPSPPRSLLPDAGPALEAVRSRARSLLDRVKTLTPDRDTDAAPETTDHGSANGEPSPAQAAREDAPPTPPMAQATGASEPTVDDADDPALNGQGGTTQQDAPAPSGFRVLRFGPPDGAPTHEDAEEERASPDLAPVEAPRPAGQAPPPVPPTTVTVQATTISLDHGTEPEANAEDAGLFARLRDRFRRDGEDPEEATEDAQPEPEPLQAPPETASPPGPERARPNEPIDDPPVPPLDGAPPQETMVALADEPDADESKPTDEDDSGGFLSRFRSGSSKNEEPEETEADATDADAPEDEESSGLMSRLRGRFSRGDEDDDAEAASEDEASTARQEEPSTAEAKPEVEAAEHEGTDTDADQAEEDAEEKSGLMSRLRGRFSSGDEEDDQAEEPTADDASDAAEADEEEPEAAEPQQGDAEDEPTEPSEGEPEEDTDVVEPVPAFEEPDAGSDAEPDAEAEAPAPTEEPLEADDEPEAVDEEPIVAEAAPEQAGADEIDAEPEPEPTPEPAAADAEMQEAPPEEPEPAPDAAGDTQAPETPSGPPPDAEQARPQEGTEGPAPAPPTSETGERVPAEPDGTPSVDREPDIDADALHERVDEVLDRYKEKPPRLLADRRR